MSHFFLLKKNPQPVSHFSLQSRISNWAWESNRISSPPQFSFYNLSLTFSAPAIQDTSVFWERTKQGSASGSFYLLFPGLMPFPQISVDRAHFSPFSGLYLNVTSSERPSSTTLYKTARKHTCHHSPSPLSCFIFLQYTPYYHLTYLFACLPILERKF